MVTLGNENIQKRKLDVLGLDGWFDKKDVYVDLFDKNFAIRKLSSGRNLNDVFVVGNSYSSDMKPALDAGIRPIYIPTGSNWHHDGEMPKDDISTLKLENILEIKRNYDDIVRSSTEV